MPNYLHYIVGNLFSYFSLSDLEVSPFCLTSDHTTSSATLMPTTRASSNAHPATTSSSKKRGKRALSTVSVQSNPKEWKKLKPVKESDDNSAEETTTMTKAALLTLGGTQYLLSLVSKAVHSLHSHYEQQCQTAMTAGDKDSEAAEILYDVELMLRKLDPVCWKELVDKQLESTGEVVKSYV